VWVKLRAATSAIATFVVAIVVALAVPVSQLRTFSTTITCCCPDPTRCHCPHEKPGTSDGPSMKPCHKVQHDSVSPQLPSFAAPDVALASAPPRPVAAPIALPDMPHAPPVPDEPYGPS
jgi:hypothetical protein